jgi:uncharacterized integral membrane protein (TIGR00698 family)
MAQAGRDRAAGATAHEAAETPDPATEQRPANPLRGALVAAALGAVALGIASAVHALPAPLLSLALGAGLAAGLRRLPNLQPGLAAAAGPGLRLGVGLLGLQVGLDRVLQLGPWALLLAVAVVTTSLATAELAGRWMGVSRPLRLLIGAGFGICGASAVAATRDAAGADDHDVAVAVTLVTICGTLAVITLPLLRPLLPGLARQETYGVLVGASVHDVAQVVAAASIAGSLALEAAIVVKLTRVVLLAPSVAAIGTLTGTRGGTDSSSSSSGGGSAEACTAGSTRAAPLPWFIALFLALVVTRSLLEVPPAVIEGAGRLQAFLLAAALAAIGARTSATTFRRMRPTVLGLTVLVWLAIGTVSALGTWWSS